VTEQSGETELTGGRTHDMVVRIGDTVRKHSTANSEFVHRVLKALWAGGFRQAPQSLGRDDEGRDVFTFIEGDVPADLEIFDDETLVRGARLIRSFHDASAGLPANLRGDPLCELVRHNDLSPCNFVFRDGAPVAIIDFDACAPGSRRSDLGYAAWLWLDLGSPRVTAAQQARRLRVFLDAYGTEPAEPVLEAVQAQQSRLAKDIPSQSDAGRAAWAEHCLAWTRSNLAVLLNGP